VNSIVCDASAIAALTEGSSGFPPCRLERMSERTGLREHSLLNRKRALFGMLRSKRGRFHVFVDRYTRSLARSAIIAEPSCPTSRISLPRARTAETWRAEMLDLVSSLHINRHTASAHHRGQTFRSLARGSRIVG
jgi:hypothetical protein